MDRIVNQRENPDAQPKEPPIGLPELRHERFCER